MKRYIQQNSFKWMELHRFSIKKTRMLLFLGFLLGSLSAVQAQTNLSGIVNTYAPVTAISGNSISVGISTGASHTWAVRDRVMLIQMTGSTNLNAGHYDQQTITSVSAGSITLSGTSLASRYDPATEKVQLIYIPYSATGFTITGTVTPLAWNGSTGGVVALYTLGTLTMNANINASCSGFRSVEPKLLTGSNIYYGGAGSNGLWVGGASGGSYGVGGYIGGFRAGPISAPGNGTYNGGTGGVDDIVPYRMGGGGGGAGAGGGGGGGAGGDHSGAGGGGASPSTGGCGGRGTDDGTAGTGSINGVGGINGSFVNNGGGGLYPAGGGGGGSKYASGGGGAQSNSTSFGFGFAGINGGAGATTNTGFGGGGGAGGVGAVANTGGVAYSLPTNNYDNFLNTTNPRVQMGGGTQGTIATQGVSGGGIVILEVNNIVGNSAIISANGCAGLMSASQSIPSSGGGGAGTIVVNVNSFTSPTTISATGGNGGNGVGATTLGNEASGGSGGGGGGAIWVKSNTPANNLNTTVSLPTVSNVTFNINGGASGSGGFAIKTSNIVSSGGCGGAGIVYTSPFSLFCNAGTEAPTLSSTSKANICPASTVDLSTITASNTPSVGGVTLTWHSGTPATTANKLSSVTALSAGTYYAAFYDATNDCYSGTSAVTATVNACATGTINCAKTQIFPAPVSGVASQHDLVVTVNVSVAGCFTPLTVSGSGMSIANNITQVCTSTNGIQIFHIPVKYDGTTILSTMNFTIGTTGSCTADLSVNPKKENCDIWTLDCVPTVGPALK
jgi:hypothetical protein